jgi:hypothetical protein
MIVEVGRNQSTQAEWLKFDKTAMFELSAVGKLSIGFFLNLTRLLSMGSSGD